MPIADPANAGAQSTEYAVGVEVVQPAGVSIQQTFSDVDIVMRPSVTTSTVGRGEQTREIGFYCYRIATGEIIPNCDLEMFWQAQPLSGGHDHHDTSRPKGTLVPSSGNSGPGGKLPTIYTAPEVSGIIEITITGRLANGTPIIPGLLLLGIRVDFLQLLPSGANYDHTGVTDEHTWNQWGTGALTGALPTVADEYAAEFPGGRLRYNDISLQDGGLFDISGQWVRPHATHRFGSNCDMGLVPRRHRNRLRQILRQNGFRVLQEGDHWHLTL